ncbi:alpha/beta hydrolase family protein [Pseudoblastomonas halimionae]|uniref:Xaa-Pro dipeptidyl-peptidase-like domain-containing protein n=1 Tax=Alteriqipengyuania halimionae TaxID=1926630 RepID=A0A6I4TZ17_9SPHN|nr:CocE/NonD family hydrolase [Alteriqipengyuania halimionae]MXP09079.1 hypothetical protein [Alteriqipengyuania halimionae]
MSHLRAALALLILAAAPAASLIVAPPETAAQDRAVADGQMLAREAYTFPFDTYEEWQSFMDRAPEERWRAAAVSPFFTPEQFDRYRSGETVRLERIAYASDGLRIKGVIAVPRDATGPLPVVIYAQGGVGEWSRLTFFDIVEMSRLAEQGFIVVASLRRGEGGSEGEPAMGSGDLSDMLNLLALIDQLPGADREHIHYLGFSRGGALGYRLPAACRDRPDRFRGDGRRAQRSRKFPKTRRVRRVCLSGNRGRL